MARYKILRETANPDYKEGESPLSEKTIFAHADDYDFIQDEKSNYTVQDHCTDLQAMHGVCFAAELIAD